MSVVSLTKAGALEAIEELSVEGYFENSPFLGTYEEIQLAARNAVYETLYRLSVRGKLRLVHTGILEPTDGQDTLDGAFPDAFWKAKPRGPCPPTNQVEFEVYQSCDGPFELDAFTILARGNPLDTLCFTESQIVALFRNHPVIFSRKNSGEGNHSTQMLFKEESGGIYSAGASSNKSIVVHELRRRSLKLTQSDWFSYVVPKF